MSLLAFFLTFVISSHVFVSAQGEEEEFDTTTERPIITDDIVRPHMRESHELLGNIQEPHPKVETKHKLLLKNNDSLIYPGDIVSVLIGFENTGNRPLFITDVVSTMTPPNEPTSFYRNFTAMHHNISVRAHESHTLEYPFAVDTRLNPLEYGLITVVFYMDLKGTEYSSVVCNRTFSVTEAPSMVDARTFLIIVTIIGAVVTAGVIFREKIMKHALRYWNQYVKGKKGKSSGGSSSVTSKQNEWIGATSTAMYAKKSVRRAASSSPAHKPASK
jgi:hypothetical protein